MKKVVAVLLVALLLTPGSIASAETGDQKRVASLEVRPLLTASLRSSSALGARSEARPGTRNSGRVQERSWTERHPVWSGAIAGFAAGYAVTYLSSDEGGIIGRGSAAMVYGGVCAGIGALVAWGVTRNDDGDYSASRTATKR
jgi:hypothetical protein